MKPKEKVKVSPTSVQKREFRELSEDGKTEVHNCIFRYRTGVPIMEAGLLSRSIYLFYFNFHALNSIL